MAFKFNQYVTINGKKRWITASSVQGIVDKVLAIAQEPTPTEKHPFSAYAWSWYRTFSEPNIELATRESYQRQMNLYLIPEFREKMVEDITTEDIQLLFNHMTGAKSTKHRAYQVLKMILDAAVEDGFIEKNPAKSKRLKIKGAASKKTQPYTVQQMRYLADHLNQVSQPGDRLFLSVLAFHPMRLEEVLGLLVEDVDIEKREIRINRAVTHPTRNQPIIKETKTSGSKRTIALSTLAIPYVPTDRREGFLFGGDKPLSYTQVRKMCLRIKKETGFEEDITPIRFRTTVLTDLYHITKDIRITQAAAGHASANTTFDYYVKYRANEESTADATDRVYGGEKKVGS